MGSQGRSPRQGLGAVAPHSAPAWMPGVYAQRLYARTHTSGRTKSVQDAPTTNDHDCTDAEPTKHTQPFTTGKGFGVRDREFALFFIKTDFFYKLKGNLIMDKAKIDRINYLARKSRERELTTEEKEEQLELRNEYRASFKRGLMSELDRVYVVDDKGKQQKLIKDNENK